jgi:hypothetical protein
MLQKRESYTKVTKCNSRPVMEYLQLNAIKCCRDDPSRELWRGNRGRVATLVVGIATDPTCNDGATNSNGNKPPKEEFCDAKVEVRISAACCEQSPEGLDELVSLWFAVPESMDGERDTYTKGTDSAAYKWYYPPISNQVDHVKVCVYRESANAEYDHRQNGLQISDGNGDRIIGHGSLRYTRRVLCHITPE